MEKCNRVHKQANEANKLSNALFPLPQLSPPLYIKYTGTETVFPHELGAVSTATVWHKHYNCQPILANNRVTTEASEDNTEVMLPIVTYLSYRRTEVMTLITSRLHGRCWLVCIQANICQPVGEYTFMFPGGTNQSPGNVSKHSAIWEQQTLVLTYKNMFSRFPPLYWFQLSLSF